MAPTLSKFPTTSIFWASRPNPLPLPLEPHTLTQPTMDVFRRLSPANPAQMLNPVTTRQSRVVAVRLLATHWSCVVVIAVLTTNDIVSWHLLFTTPKYSKDRDGDGDAGDGDDGGVFCPVRSERQPAGKSIPARRVLEISPMDTIVHVHSRAYWCNSKHEYQWDNGCNSQEHSRRAEHRPLSISYATNQAISSLFSLKHR